VTSSPLNRPPRVLLSKVGLDGHDVGILLLAKRLRSEGFEVIYLGKRNRPNDIARAAAEEDVQAVGVSSLSGGAAELAIATAQALHRESVDVPLFAAGIAEDEEIDRMLRQGVAQFFGPACSLEDVVQAFHKAVGGSPASPDSTKKPDQRV
jgi:methylmalonyl-CoA mutase C-terminal domain/subunit